MPREYILVKFMEPIRKEYFSGDNCAPRLRGEGCYGDCADCFHRDREKYERMSKFGKKAVYHE